MDLGSGFDMIQRHRRQYFIDHNGEGYKDLAGSENSCMHGSFLREDWEALYLALVDCTKVRSENPMGVTQ